MHLQPMQVVLGSDVQARAMLCCVLQYSSAAPLTADARQRIVSEVFDLRRFVTVSMTVGPASGVLKEQPEESWKPRDVALTVLIDRYPLIDERKGMCRCLQQGSRAGALAAEQSTVATRRLAAQICR